MVAFLGVASVKNEQMPIRTAPPSYTIESVQRACFFTLKSYPAQCVMRQTRTTRAGRIPRKFMTGVKYFYSASVYTKGLLLCNPDCEPQECREANVWSADTNPRPHFDAPTRDLRTTPLPTDAHLLLYARSFGFHPPGFSLSKREAVPTRPSGKTSART